MQTKRNSFGKLFYLFVGLMIPVVSCLPLTDQYEAHLAPSISRVRNVIVMVPDGCPQGIPTLARWVKGEALTVDKLASGSVRTSMASSIITGSAAAATAFSTGQKTTIGFLGIAPRQEDILTTFSHPGPDMAYRPMVTVLEAAQQRGKSTGLVATSRVTHATPAAFASHVDNRNNENDIMEYLVYHDIDIVFGGGKRYLLPQEEKGKRSDGENLLDVLKSKGYQFVENKSELAALTTGKSWGMFAKSHMEPALDRPEFAPEQPSLAEMTAKAIELLKQDADGFFLLVEGSQVDWGGHANDPVYMVSEFLAFDEAVRVARDFAAKDGNTLVLVFPDHATGGFNIGNKNTNRTYTKTKVEELLAPLARMRLTTKGLMKKIGEDTSYENVAAVIKEWWGVDISKEDYNEILATIDEKTPMDYAIGEVVSRNSTIIGWTTHGHVGNDVPLWSYGPGRPIGSYENTDLARITAAALKADLVELNRSLFVEVGSVFSEYHIDNSDAANPVLRIGAAELPINKDELRLHGKTYDLDNIVIHAEKTGKTYIPQQAVDIINRAGI